MNLKKLTVNMLAILLIGAPISHANSTNKKVDANADGLQLPENYQDWRIISSSHRIDNKSMRIILGNDIAVKAARSNNINPWPDGAIIGKLVWKQGIEKDWPTAIAPKEFIHAEFMYKDSVKFKDNGTGWGWARWLGEEQKPYGNEQDLDQSCISCHTPVKGKDWVYTVPVQLP